MYLSYSKKIVDELADERKGGLIVVVFGILWIVIITVLGITVNRDLGYITVIGMFIIRKGLNIIRAGSVPSGAVAVGRLQRSGRPFSFNSKGIYAGKARIARWNEVEDVQVIEKDATTGLGSIMVVLRRPAVRQLVVTKVLQPDMLVDYLKRTYLSPSNPAAR